MPRYYNCNHYYSDHHCHHICCIAYVYYRWEDSEDLAVSANDFMRSGLQAAYKVPLVKKMK